MLLLRIKQVNTMLFNFLLSFFRLYWHKVLSRRQTFICDINVNWFNFLIFAKSHADCALYGRGWVGDKTYIKAFTTLWFWRLEILRKFHASQGQSNVNVLRGYVVHIPQFCIDSQWCLRTSVARYVGFMGELYEHIGVGLRRCSFRLTGQCEGL